MGRAVFLSFPSFGHLTPGLAVVGELVRRGEQVDVFAAERSRDAVAAAGATPRLYPVPYERFDPTPPTAGLFADMPRLLGLTEEILPTLLAELETARPDYVLLDSKSVWGRLAAAVLGIPAVTMSVVFAIKQGVITPAALVELMYGAAPPQALVNGLRGFGAYAKIAGRLRRRYGLRVPDLIEFLGNPSPLNVIFTSRALQPNDRVFGDDYRFVGLAVSERRGGGEGLPFERLGGPVVYVSLGTTFNDAPAFYRACFEAFGGMPYQVVLATGRGGDGLGAAPDNFIVRPFVPQLRLLELSAAFVTHGGMNSVNEGLAAGVPLAVVPQRGDQFLVGARVAQHGAGISLGPGDATPERLRETVGRLLYDPAFRQNAVALGRTLLEAGGASRAAEEILRHVATGMARHTLAGAH